jgi:hypothetical protein
MYWAVSMALFCHEVHTFRLAFSLWGRFHESVSGVIYGQNLNEG